jgi:hypothetical protein
VIKLAHLYIRDDLYDLLPTHIYYYIIVYVVKNVVAVHSQHAIPLPSTLQHVAVCRCPPPFLFAWTLRRSPPVNAVACGLNKPPPFVALRLERLGANHVTSRHVARYLAHCAASGASLMTHHRARPPGTQLSILAIEGRPSRGLRVASNACVCEVGVSAHWVLCVVHDGSTGRRGELPGI